MIIKVPVSEVTVGESNEDSIANMRKESVIGRITMAKAKKMFPDYTVVSVASHYVKYDVSDAAVEALIENAAE